MILKMNFRSSACPPFSYEKPLVYKNNTQRIKIEITGQGQTLHAHITHTVKNAWPGFYMINYKLIDYFGQPHLDMNVVFRTESKVTKTWESEPKDSDLRKKHRSAKYRN